MPAAIALCLALVIAVLPVQRCLGEDKRVPSTKTLTVSVLWDDAMSGKDAGIWMGYLFARMKYVSSHGGRYERKLGVVAPLYDEEVHARTEAVHIYRDLRARKPEMSAAYFDALERVEAAGYMREYVWRYLRRPEWSEPEVTLRDGQFTSWARVHLIDHQAETRGRIALTHGSS